MGDWPLCPAIHPYHQALLRCHACHRQTLWRCSLHRSLSLLRGCCRCCAVAVPCCAVLCHALLCCVMPCYTRPYSCAVLCCVRLAQAAVMCCSAVQCPAADRDSCSAWHPATPQCDAACCLCLRCLSLCWPMSSAGCLCLRCSVFCHAELCWTGLCCALPG